MREIHCEYCQCPKDVWKKSMTTYNGDECKLYSDFMDSINDLEEASKPFNDDDILKKFKLDFSNEYSGIKDFEPCVNEMIGINIDLGVMPSNYRHLRTVL